MIVLADDREEWYSTELNCKHSYTHLKYMYRHKTACLLSVVSMMSQSLRVNC